MIRIGGLEAVPAHLRGAILALGNFDGFHAGHQAVVGEATAWARAEGHPVIVATFDPHPVRYFKPDIAPFRLTSLDQRARLFAEAGADAMLTFAFDAALAGLDASAFIQQQLIERIGAAGVVTGEDFTFGARRSGSVAVLREVGGAMGLASRAVAPVTDADGVVISSSRIRDALAEGDCPTATALLTRPYALAGTVIHGDKRGRTIGYPTANVALTDFQRPAYGVYAVRARLADGSTVNGAANIGIRPMFDPPVELLETFLLDWSGDLYGQAMEVALIARLRGEAKFDGLDALVRQMDADIATARQILGKAPRAL